MAKKMKNPVFSEPVEGGKAKKAKKVEDASVAENPEENKDGLTVAQKNSIADDFNKNFSEFGTLTVCTDEKDQEETKTKAEKEFKDLIDEFKKSSFEIAPKEKALETAKFLQAWNEKSNQWEKMAWKGVIEFDKQINEEILKLEKEEGPLSIAYDALVFLYSSMMNVRGKGLQDALDMEVMETSTDENDKEPVTYSNVLDIVGKHIDRIKMIDEKLQMYQQRWAMAESGMKLEFKKDLELEEYAKFADQLKSGVSGDK